MTSQVQIETQNKEVVQRYWDGKWNKRSPEILDELQTPDVIYHGTSMNMNGIEEYKQVYGSFLSAFHDTQITVEELIAEGDKVTSRVSLKGTHKGEFDGLPPTGKVFTAKAFTIFRLVDGKIVEEWEAFDELGLMHQLGMELRPTGDVESNELARDLEAITALREENLAAINASDVSTLLTEFTDDVVFLPDDQPPVVGKAALEAWVRPIYEQYDFEIEGTVKEVVVAGDWAFEWGLLTGTFRLLAGGEDMQVDMKYVYVYERQPDGSWRCAYDIVNKNVPSVYPVPIQD